MKAGTRLEIAVTTPNAKLRLTVPEVVADYRTIGRGMGGIREDTQQFDMSAHI